MKIDAVAYSIPSQRLTNEDILALLEQNNPDAPKQLKNRYLTMVEKLFGYTGAKTRYFRDLINGETASEHIISAMNQALSSAGMGPNNIDLLIYCGVGRGFLEPANAYFFAKECQMQRANCFDVTDACMSWIRALQIARDMQKAGSVQNVMVINGEFHLGIHDNWSIRDIGQLTFTFPMYTIGEAATATILTPSEHKWEFTYSSQPEHAELCTIPLPGHESYHQAHEKIGLNGVNKFESWGQELLSQGQEALSQLMTETIPDPTAHDLYFPHAPAERIYLEGFKMLGFPKDRIYSSIYRNFGNIVSASIPVGLANAQKEGRLKRGDKIAMIPASAGLVASVTMTTF